MTPKVAEVSLRAWSTNKHFADLFLPRYELNVTTSKSASGHEEACRADNPLQTQYYSLVTKEDVNNCLELEHALSSILSYLEENEDVLEASNSRRIDLIIWIAVFSSLQLNNLDVSASIIRKALSTKTEIFCEVTMSSWEIAVYRLRNGLRVPPASLADVTHCNDHCCPKKQGNWDGKHLRQPSMVLLALKRLSLNN